MFRCNLPPAFLAEWPGSFTCHCGKTGVERTPNKSQHTELTLKNKILSPLRSASCRSLNVKNKLSPLLICCCTRCYCCCGGGGSVAFLAVFVVLDRSSFELSPKTLPKVILYKVVKSGSDSFPWLSSCCLPPSWRWLVQMSALRKSLPNFLHMQMKSCRRLSQKTGSKVDRSIPFRPLIG